MLYIKILDIIESVKIGYSSNSEKFGCFFVFLLHTLFNTQQGLVLGKIYFISFILRYFLHVNLIIFKILNKLKKFAHKFHSLWQVSWKPTVPCAS